MLRWPLEFPSQPLTTRHFRDYGYPRPSSKKFSHSLMEGSHVFLLLGDPILNLLIGEEAMLKLSTVVNDWVERQIKGFYATKLVGTSDLQVACNSDKGRTLAVSIRSFFLRRRKSQLL